MSDDKDVEIDPRFDAAFQRGFDPRIPIEEYVPDPLPKRAPTVPDASAAPAAPSVAPRPDAPPAPAIQPAEPDAVAAVGFGPDSRAADTESAPVEFDSNPARNPFLLLLAIVAIALVAVGVWLFVQAGDSFNSSEVPSQGAYMSLTATITTAPFIALLGAATAIGVVFVFAAQWQRRR